jgi:NTP pyrophosphatase (non-canonical NTP hydrolase)
VSRSRRACVRPPGGEDVTQQRNDGLERLRQRVATFATVRDWQQFHTPKNLVMALAAEVGELIELFQWLTPEESRLIADHHEGIASVRDELGDVLIYLVRVADVLGVDLIQAATDKLEKNAVNYPGRRRRERRLRAAYATGVSLDREP